MPWSTVIITTSILALVGGSLIFFLVADGPFRKPGQALDLTAFFRVFNNRKFRAAAFGYFGHMWELYTFWTFVPVMLAWYSLHSASMTINTSVWSFVIIGIGGIACVIGGYLSQDHGEKNIASSSLLMSGISCVLSPFILLQSSMVILLIFLSIWGMVVIADSPLFSTLVAHNADSEVKGTALTIVNCIGFSITIISIQLMTYLRQLTDSEFLFWILAIGPAFGLIALFGNSNRSLVIATDPDPN